MPVIPVDPRHPDPAVIARAAAVIRRGGLVAFPTETVYGLGANALDVAAVERVFAAKGRPSYNPLIAHVPTAAAARALVRDWPDVAQRLADEFWPGPLTLVLPKHPDVPDVMTAGLPHVAVRMPAHPVALALLHAAGVPVAAPSANRFTELSPTRAEHVAKTLGDRVELILDGGPTSIGIESTVVDLSEERAVLLRPGAISATELTPFVGALALPAPVTSPVAARRSPGMVDRHYAPKAQLYLFPSHSQSEIAALARDAVDAGRVIGALLLTRLPAPIQHPVLMPNDPAGYAQRLYSTLHALDDAGCDLTLVERVPADPAWDGVRDRLERAAH
jgi:L-threonylcarbamoyladenylate synthase